MKSRRAGGTQKKAKAVSPVIGVILMVAITVILAAVIGTTVVELSDQNEPAERAVVDVVDVRDKSPNEVQVNVITAGDVRNDELFLAFKGTRIQHEDGSPGPADRLSWRELNNYGTPPPSQRLSAGDTAWFEPPNSNPSVEGREVVVIYDNGDTESVVYEFGSLSEP
jgi:flagellin-like protein